MQKVRCDECGNESGLNETLKISGRVLCNECIEQLYGDRSDLSADEIERVWDPTMCADCGRDNEDTALGTLAEIPICPQCEHFYRHRPFPRWVKAGFAALVGLVLFSLLWNGRYIMAYRDMKSAMKLAARQDFDGGAQMMESASGRVPECRILELLAPFTRGVALLHQEKYAKAAAKFRLCRGQLPEAYGVNRLLLSALIGEAFEKKDYDRFLEIARQLDAEYPNDGVCAAQVASAYACKYAVTGEEVYRDKSLKELERAQGLSQADPSFGEYEQRIRYRLHTREMITRKEFIERFPNGWQAPGKE